MAEMIRKQPNKRTLEWVRDHYALPDGFEVIKVGDAGFGIAATKNHKYHHGNTFRNYVGDYKGVKMHKNEHAKKYPPGSDDTYSIRIGTTDYYIDASNEASENWARFINDPGVRTHANVEFVQVMNTHTVGVELIRDIDKGDQMLVNYNAEDDENGHAFIATRCKFGKPPK